MNDPLDAIFVTGDEAAELKRTDTARKLATYLERMPAKLRGMFAEQFQHISSAELAQLRDDSLLLIGSNRLLSEIGALLNCAPDATILDSISALRSDLQAAQDRNTEARKALLAWYVVELNECGEDVLPLMKQLDEVDLYESGDDFLPWAQELRRSWLAANPVPEAEPQP